MAISSDTNIAVTFTKAKKYNETLRAVKAKPKIKYINNNLEYKTNNKIPVQNINVKTYKIVNTTFNAVGWVADILDIYIDIQDELKYGDGKIGEVIFINLVGLAGGYLGGQVGALVGSMVAPGAGTFIGSVAGAYLGSTAGEALAEYIIDVSDVS